MHRRFTLQALVLCALFFTSSACWAKDGELPLDRTVRMGKLDNGLTYYIKPDSRFDRTHVELVINAGYGDEGKEQVGLSHLLEHLAFSWSPEYPNTKVREFFSKNGILPSSGYNASTGLSTRYWVSVPGRREGVLGESFNVVRGWLDQMVLTESRMNLERSVVLSEVRGNDNAVEFSVGREIMYRLLDSPHYDINFRKIYDESIENASFGALERFYNDWYRPDLAAVIVVGPVNIEKTEEQLRHTFGQVRPKPSAPAKVDTLGNLRVELTGRSQYFSKFDARLPGIIYTAYRKRPGHSDARRSLSDLRRQNVDTLLNELIRSRLEEAVSTLALGCSVRASLRPFWSSLTQIDTLESGVVCRDASGSEESLRRLQLALDQMMAYGFTGKEISRAKVSVRESKQGDPVSQATEANVLAENFLRGTPIIASAELGAVNEELLTSITSGELLQRLRSFQERTKDFDVVATGNERFAGEALSKKQLDAIFLQKPQGIIPRFVSIEAPSQVMTAAQRDRLPTSTVLEDTWIDEIGARKVALSNGVIIYFIDNGAPPSSGVPISIEGFRPFGCTISERAACENVALLAASAGLADLPGSQVSAFRKAKGIRSSVFLDGHQSIITAVTPSASLESALQVILLTLTDLRPDAERFLVHEKERYYSEPELGFVAALDRKLQMERAERVGVRAEQEIETGLPAFKASIGVFDRNLKAKGDFTFVISGQLNVEQALPLTLRYLGALPVTAPTLPQAVDTGESFKTTPVEQRIELPNAVAGTLNQKGYGRLYIGGQYEDTLINRIELELLGSILEQAMFARLREGGGGVYSPGAGIEVLRPPPGQNIGTYRIVIRFQADPGKLDGLVDAARGEVMELAEKGIPQSFVDQAIAQSSTGSRAVLGDDSWGRSLRKSLSRGEDPSEILKRQSILGSVITKEMLDRAARRYLHAENARVTIVTPSTSN